MSQTPSQFERVPCNICGSGQTCLVFTKWNFRIVQCVDCGLVYVNPRTFRIEPDDYFAGPYLSAIEKNGRLDPGIATLYGEILYNLGNRVASGKLLDIGCAMGHFLGFAKDNGWDVEGVECSPYAARYAEQHFAARVHPVCVLADAKLPAGDYDAAVLSEVIGHLPDPYATMCEVRRLLKPGGIAYLTTPNFGSYRSLLLRAQWAAVIPVGQLYYFDADSLGKLLSCTGFINVEDLTGSATFGVDYDFAVASGQLKLSPEKLEAVKNIARMDEQPGVRNHRGEGLIMCARKPWDATAEQPPTTGRVLSQVLQTSFEGCLVRRPGDTPEDQKVYFVENGRKRWVTSAGWIVSKGMNWPDDVQLITPEEFESIPPGPPLE